MNRGKTGLLPRTPTLEDESYLAYFEGVRNFAIGTLFPVAAQQIEVACAKNATAGPTTQVPIATLRKTADALPLICAWKRVMRSQQQSTWHKIRASLHANRAQYEQELDNSERQRPNRLHFSADFQVPAYASLPIHLQTGGYVGDSLAGFVFHHGTKVFYQGANDQDELHRDVVRVTAEPEDGRVRQILDLGCSIGQCTTALKQRWPDAEVTGLDVALPLLRYAHKRATDLGVDVHFTQRLAEDTGLPDGKYDLILAYILFHEVPSKLFRPIVREVRRLLRPGGTFTIVDAPNGTQFPAPNRVWMDFDAQFNCEPYSPAFVATDFQALLAEEGLRVTEYGPTGGFLMRTASVKPV